MQNTDHAFITAEFFPIYNKSFADTFKRRI